MTHKKPPATVQQLLAQSKASIANIELHRKAMAEVAAKARTAINQQRTDEGAK